jgi:phage-related protein
MTRESLAAGEKPLYWIASSFKDFMTLPFDVRRSFGLALDEAQFGGKDEQAKPWKGQGPGVFEIVEDHRGDTYRAIYTVRFEDAVYVLHIFQKKSKRGIKTDLGDQRLVESRLKMAEQEHKELYG